ncbi:hypothetical protein E0485_05840 [Paenibacillus albiflavus]|uniref:Uncharacterized protein n=1 Tax=Paenibacillus albiflavus TaxID=2545760 RepID=A0A4V2WPH4_9BACL|nr:hypothetical protein [Paenibacillus albiflavus]TCZ79382.1 hypothetical protein E0485_05840 [Paenibacillus albiflavus]
MIFLRFEDIKSGWCRITFGTDEIEAELSVSYLTDFISDLINRTAILLEGSDYEVIKCYYEPGQYILSLNRMMDQISISIAETQSSGSLNIYNGTDQLKKFGRVLLKELERVKNEKSITQYNEEWKYKFPEDTIERLRKAVKA